MTTDTSEKGLERLICESLTGAPCDAPRSDLVGERPASYGAGWICGDPRDYDREFCVDLAQLSAFLRATQPVVAASLSRSAVGFPVWSSPPPMQDRQQPRMLRCGDIDHRNDGRRGSSKGIEGDSRYAAIVSLTAAYRHPMI